jgi:hypothetical protein
VPLAPFKEEERSWRAVDILRRGRQGKVQITELHPVSEPVVFGYLKADTCTEARTDALRRVLGTYCEQHELNMAAVIIDRADPLAFDRLITAVVACNGYAVVVPSAPHLGGKGVAEARCEAINRAKARLMIVRPRPSQSIPILDQPW